MNIPEDYLRACEGGDHLARETLRHHIINERLDMCLDLISTNKDIFAKQISAKVVELKTHLANIGK